jgi:hypothetical protein
VLKINIIIVFNRIGGIIKMVKIEEALSGLKYNINNTKDKTFDEYWAFSVNLYLF